MTYWRKELSWWLRKQWWAVQCRLVGHKPGYLGYERICARCYRDIR